VLDNPLQWWEENSPRGWAVSGYQLQDIKNGIDAEILNHESRINLIRNVFLINVGVNDVNPEKATWKANYQYVIDALVAKWSDAEIFIVKPWKRSGGAKIDSMAIWIDQLINENPTTCFYGHDERVWLEGGDDGATMTSDGTHYSVAGQAECVNQWKIILGY